MKVPAIVARAGFKLAKHSPTILVTVGVIGTIASTVGACVATRNLDEIIEADAKGMATADDKNFKLTDEQRQSIRMAPNEGGVVKPLTDKERKHFKRLVRLRTVISLVKNYWLPALGLTVSIACIIGAHVILRRRNAILTASLASATKAFEEYRKRVSARFGDDVERQIRLNMQPDGDPVTVVDVDENGKTHKSKIQNYVIDPTKAVDESIIYFTPYTARKSWKQADIYNEDFIQNQINWAKEKFKAERFLFTNYVRESLEVDRTVEGQAMGWDNDDYMDCNWSAATFKDPDTGEVYGGYVIEMIGIKNILDMATWIVMIIY